MSATVLEKGGQTVGGSSNAWDTLGRLTGTTNLLGAAELHYDEETGQVSWTKTVTAGGSNNYTNHTYGYEAAGRLKTWAKNVVPSGS